MNCRDCKKPCVEELCPACREQRRETDALSAELERHPIVPSNHMVEALKIRNN